MRGIIHPKIIQNYYCEKTCNVLYIIWYISSFGLLSKYIGYLKNTFIIRFVYNLCYVRYYKQGSVQIMFKLIIFQ